MSTGTILQVVLLASSAVTAPVVAQTLRVPSQYPTIQAAIQAAPTGAEVLVNGPRITISAPIDTLGKALTLRANGFVALDALLRSRVFHIHSGETRSTVIQGFSIENGYPSLGSSLNCGGGAVIENGAAPRFVDCVFRECAAGFGGDGGGVFVRDASPSFERCTFNGNQGGSGSNGFRGVTGRRGSLSNPDGGTGGRGSDGSAGGHGGAAYVEGTGRPVFQNCAFLWNRPGKGGDGGSGGVGGEGWSTLGFYVGNGGRGGPGGNGGRAGDGTLAVAGAASALVVNCTFFGNQLAAPGRAGGGGAGGQGASPGGRGIPGFTSLPTRYPGVFAGSSNTEVFNSVFWNDETIWGTSTFVGTSDVVGTTPSYCASRRPMVGIASFQLSFEPFEPGTFYPIAGGQLVDRAVDYPLPAHATLDYLGGPRRFDDLTVPGLLDIGAVEERTGRAVEFGCGQNPVNTLLLASGPIAAGSAFTVRMADPTGSIHSGSLAALAVNTGVPSLACGTSIPNYGIVPGQAGESLLPMFEVLRTAIFFRGSVDFVIPVPNDQNLVGLNFTLQGVFLDPTNANIGLTRGLWGNIGDR